MFTYCSGTGGFLDSPVCPATGHLHRHHNHNVCGPIGEQRRGLAMQCGHDPKTPDMASQFVSGQGRDLTSQRLARAGAEVVGLVVAQLITQA